MKYEGILIHDIVLYKHPLIYLQLLAEVVVDLLIWLKDFIIRRFLILLCLGAVAALVLNV